MSWYILIDESGNIATLMLMLKSFYDRARNRPLGNLLLRFYYSSVSICSWLGVTMFTLKSALDAERKKNHELVKKLEELEKKYEKDIVDKTKKSDSPIAK